MKSLKLIPLNGLVQSEISIPGSKSYTNRALVMAALTKGPVKIINPLISDDIEAMIGCLKTLGIEVIQGENSITVVGDISQVKDGEYDLNCQISGTTIRFILALSCLVPGIKTIYGEEGLNKRPIGELVEGLKALGADIECLKQSGFPPLKVK